MSWTVLSIRYRVYDMKDKFLLLLSSEAKIILFSRDTQ